MVGVYSGTVTVGATDNTGTARREMLLDASSKKKEDGQSQSEYLAALRTLGEQELAKHTRLENFEFTPTGPVTWARWWRPACPAPTFRQRPASRR